MAGNHLPSDMVLAYKRYKRDTEAVAGWLAQKATQLGYIAAASASLPKQPKLKGRARKLARDAAKQAPPIEAKYSYAVKTTEFVEMARKVVNARPKIILSRSLRTMWERAIRARRHFSAWFKSRASTDPLADEKHSHFTTVLEAALEILKPCYEQLETPKQDSKVKQELEETNLEQLNNMFQHLDVEDTTSDEESEQAEPTTKKPVPSTAPRAQIDFDDEEAEAEFLFAIWSFLQDVTAVRVYVACTWQLYSAGSVELMQAASVTNLGVDLVRRAEADFEATLQRPPKYPASKFPTGSLPFLIFKLHLPAANGGNALDFDPDQPSTIIICGCEICDMLMYMPWVMAKNCMSWPLRRDVLLAQELYALSLPSPIQTSDNMQILKSCKRFLPRFQLRTTTSVWRFLGSLPEISSIRNTTTQRTLAKRPKPSCVRFSLHAACFP